jgi:hypothetical protein
MIYPEEQEYCFTCDVCHATARGLVADQPPPGFAIIWIRPDRGIGAVAHLCATFCLIAGAGNLAEGKAPDGSSVS